MQEAYKESCTAAVWTVLAPFDGDSSFASAAGWKAAQQIAGPKGGPTRLEPGLDLKGDLMQSMSPLGCRGDVDGPLSGSTEGLGGRKH